MIALSALLLLAAPRGAHAQDELLLNDDRVQRSQWAPRAALGATGAVAFVWMDGRNGPGSFVDYDIYLTTMRDPRALGAKLNRRVNDDVPGATQSAPDIAGSPAGTFFCVWEDSRTGNPDIYGCALDSLGIPLGPNIRVNDDPGATDQRTPQVTAVGPDRYLVVWGDQRSGQSDIFASYRSASGAPIGGNITISQDPVPGGSFQGNPAAASNAAGRTLVVWLDSRAAGSTFGDTLDVYGQWLDGTGTTIGGNFRINDVTAPKRNASPTVAADPSTGFVVAWVDRRSSPADPGDIYAQRFDASGLAIGGNVRVNDDSPGHDQRSVKAVSGPGGAFVCWEDVRDAFTLDVNVDASLVPYDAGAPAVNVRVNSDTPGRQGLPGGAWDGTGAYDIVWEDGRNGATDIYGVSVTATGVRNGVDTQLNDDAAPYDQWQPRLGDGPGVYFATWIDLRNGTNDLYGQWIFASGAREGPNLRLWQDDFLNRPIESDAAVSDGGVGLVVATITRMDDAGEIRGFLLPAVGADPASSFWITDSLPSAQSRPAVVVKGGEFGLAWIDTRDGAPRIYGQRILSDGSRDGSNHPVLSTDPQDPVSDLDLAADPLGGYWVLYVEGVEADQRLWLTHLDATLSQDRASVAVSPGSAGGRATPRLACAADGRVEVVWTGLGTTGVGRVFYQAFDAGGAPLAAALPIGDPAGTDAQGAPSIAVGVAGTVVAWEGKGANPDWSIWMQRFVNGAPASGVIRVDEDPGHGEQYDPGVGIDLAGHIVVVWADARSISSGSDILGRVFETAPTSVTEGPPPLPEPHPSPPRALQAGPARPNPFSDVTDVPVRVSAGAGLTRVVVVNARGERVATLMSASASASAPSAMIRWDGRDDRGRRAASGTYWLLIEGGTERRVLRLVLLR